MTRGQRNRSIGDYGEQLAARRLVEAGMVVVDRNWRCGAGEIDLVLRDGEVLVVCEVKTRTTEAFGHPLEAVGRAKADRLHALADLWLHDHGLSSAPVRIDLVGVLVRPQGPPEVTHLRGVG